VQLIEMGEMFRPEIEILKSADYQIVLAQELHLTMVAVVEWPEMVN
jgi:hypothetical protein